eukprot:4297995-Amphidinium_carterae.1
MYVLWRVPAEQGSHGGTAMSGGTANQRTATAANESQVGEAPANDGGSQSTEVDISPSIYNGGLARGGTTAFSH